MQKNKLSRSAVTKISGRAAQRGNRAKIHKSRKKIAVGIIFGGPSVEHQVSIWSAQNIARSCLSAGYAVRLFYVQKDGSWLYMESQDLITESAALTFDYLKRIQSNSVSVVPAKGFFVNGKKIAVDVIFPIIHGTMGEDGVLQGFLEVAGIPYVGCGVLASSIGMDKTVAKSIAAQAGIPVAPYLVVLNTKEMTYEGTVKKFGLPFFVKPATLGSSVGISKVRSRQDFARAMRLAFSVDKKVIIEKMIVGREVECALLTDKTSRISGIGEVSTTHDFYSYEAKYVDENSVKIMVPAKVSKKASKIIRTHAQKIVQVFGLHGLARIDFFLTKSDEVVFNEVNTLPGFTNLSMYPRLWRQEGYTDERLLRALVQHALQK